MNALIGPVEGFTTAYGHVSGLADITDLWGDWPVVQGFLEANPGYFLKESRDQISAHITTGQGRVFVHRIDTDPWGPPRGAARDTLRLLDKLAHLLGVKALYYAPGSRGLALLDFTRADHKEWFSRELPPDWERADSAITPNFTRTLNYKAAGEYLHKWDTRAAWLASARTTRMGFGGWRRLPKFDPKAPGIWPVMLRKPYPVTNCPIVIPGWYPTEIVRAAIDHGQAVEVGPGQGWGSTATPLRSFCERLMRARSGAGAEGRTPEEVSWLQGSMKAIYTRTFGSLDGYRKSAPWAHQPHWYYQLRAESARRMWRHYAYSPYMVGIETDALYAVAPRNVDPASICPSATPNAWNPGTIRYEGCTPVTRELLDLLGGPGSKVRDWLTRRQCLEPWEGDE